MKYKPPKEERNNEKDSENSIRILNNIVNGLYSSTVTNQPDALPLNTKEKFYELQLGPIMEDLKPKKTEVF